MSGPTLGLSRITALLSVLGSPQLRVPCIHIAGTNGKGSVSAFLDNILRASGLRTGRFNSPHFLTVRDSILIHGSPVTSDFYEDLQARVDRLDRQHQIQASSFERLTATAFLAFSLAQPPLDVAFLEVGLGGTEDATNVIPNPLLSIITPVDLDHQAILGHSVAEIAKHKAGIIKTKRPVVVSPQTHAEAAEVILHMAQQHGSHIVHAVPARHSSDQSHIWPVQEDQSINLQIPLPGPHQLQNAGTALTAAHFLQSNQQCTSLIPSLSNITLSSMRQGIEQTRWPGRLSWLNATLPFGRHIRVLADGAHNPASAQNLRAFLDTLPVSKLRIWVIGCSAPRPPKALLQPLLCSGDTVIASKFTTQPEGMEWVKAVDPNDITTAARALGVVEVRQTHSAQEALSVLNNLIDDDQKTNEPLIIFAGSLYFIADVYRCEDIQPL